MQFDLRGKMVYYMPRFFEIRFVRTSSLRVVDLMFIRTTPCRVFMSATDW